MLKDKLQIILITYNRTKYLRNTLLQIFGSNSPVKNFDITILDNNSDDGTDRLVQAFMQHHKNLKYIKNNRNIGGNANICRAYEIANKEYVWVLCDDDILDFTNWAQAEKAILDGYSCVMVSNYIEPTKNVAQFVAQSTFVPSCIYQTKIIDSTTITNMYTNCLFMFPQMALISKIINKKLTYKILDKWIVKMQINNEDCAYTRGLDRTDVHPIFKDMFWEIGFINSLCLINDVKIREEIIENFMMHPEHNKLFLTPEHIFYENKRAFSSSKWNIASVYASLGFSPKLLSAFKKEKDNHDCYL